MQTHGRIVLVQEDRFVLADDAGRKQLFLVSHKLSFNPEDLRALARSQSRIAIEYESAPHLVAAIAHRIKLAEPA